MNTFKLSRIAQAIVLMGSSLVLPHVAQAANDLPLPTGQYITPLAPFGAAQQLLNPQLPGYPDFIAGEAVRSQLSPDGNTLAILTAGQNTLYKPDGSVDTANSTQFIFLYDLSGRNEARPKLMQVIQQTNAYVGLAWAPDGKTLYATGGNDDAVYAYAKSGGVWTQAAKIALGHSRGVGLSVQPNAGGLAVSPDGKTLVVANNYNDSISVIDTASNTVRYEHDLRPYFAGNEGTDGAAGGTYPFAVVVNAKGVAYVSANRDREVVAVDVSSPTAGHLVARIKLAGNPLGMALDTARNRLYVAQDNADEIGVIDMASNTVFTNIDTRGPAGLMKPNGDAPRYTGAAPIAVTLAPNGNVLYAVNDGANSVAVIALKGPRANQTIGLIPTAYAPKDISFSADGNWMYIINGKSRTGPNTDHLFGNTKYLSSADYVGGVIENADGSPATPAKTSAYPAGTGCDSNCQSDNASASAASKAANQYQFQLEHASLVSAPVPTLARLPELTRQVAQNNFYENRPDLHDQAVMGFLHQHIKHVIYIVKENRTFDQILGDLNNGANAEPALAVFGQAITPNLHKLATNFVTLDNFMDPGDGSMDGWSWSLQARVTNTEAITQQINYAGVNRGLSYESEGSNRNVPVNWGTVAERDAVAGTAGTTNYTDAANSQNLPGGVDNLLAGNGDHASSDAPFGQQKGYIFDTVLKAGGSVRNYGFLVNNIGNSCTDANDKPPCSSSAPAADPHAEGIVQTAALDPNLADFTDVYFRGYDNNYSDLWRYNEWKREFDQYVSGNNLPSLSMVRFSHDHMGNFGTALAGVNTPETQQADDDLAVGKLVEAVAHSPYADDTLIVVTEDDCQDGPDHVDSHRATTYMVGAYVKKNAVVSTHYSQVNVLRTIEDIFAAPHMNLNTAYQSPMTDVFDIKAAPAWTYTAEASTVLATTSLDLGGTALAAGPAVKPGHDATYWAKATAGFDFSRADEVPPTLFNQVLWRGMKGKQPYPGTHSLWTASADRD